MVLPAPKTPSTAKSERPVLRARIKARARVHEWFCNGQAYAQKIIEIFLLYHPFTHLVVTSQCYSFLFGTVGERRDGMAYAVFGVGNSQWHTYQQFPRSLFAEDFRWSLEWVLRLWTFLRAMLINDHTEICIDIRASTSRENFLLDWWDAEHSMFWHRLGSIRFLPMRLAVFENITARASGPRYAAHGLYFLLRRGRCWLEQLWC